MKKCAWVSRIAAVLCVLGLGGVAAAGDKWEERDKGGGATIFSKDKAGSDVDVIKGVIQLPYTTAEVARILTSNDPRDTFIPDMKHFKILKEEKLPTGRLVQFIHQISAVPVISDREVIVRAETWSEPGDKGDTWHSTFKATLQNAPPPNADIVRIVQLEGAWVLKPTGDGKGSVFTYTAHAEVGGNVPDFMAESGQIDNLLQMLKNLRALCVKHHGAR